MTMGFFVVPVLGLVLACGLGGQIDEANKLASEANDLVTVHNADVDKSEPLQKDFSEISGLSNADELKKFKSKNKAKLDELVALTTKMEKTASDAADKYEQASKMKIDDMAKEYFSLQGQALRKSADIDKELLVLLNSTIESKTPKEISKLFDDFTKKRDEYTTASEDLRKKADEISKDHPENFKK